MVACSAWSSQSLFSEKDFFINLPAAYLGYLSPLSMYFSNGVSCRLHVFCYCYYIMLNKVARSSCPVRHDKFHKSEKCGVEVVVVLFSQEFPPHLLSSCIDLVVFSNFTSTSFMWPGLLICWKCGENFFFFGKEKDSRRGLRFSVGCAPKNLLKFGMMKYMKSWKENGTNWLIVCFLHKKT